MTDFSKALKFIRGTLDATQFVPAFRNYAIRDKVVQGSDGTITLAGVIDVPFDVCVDAVRFVRAIAACESNPEDIIDLTLTPKGSLRVKAGKFSAIVPTTTNVDEFPWAEPEGDAFGITDEFLEALRRIRPYIGTDATRPWSLGILIRDGMMYATNNVLLVSSELKDDVWADVPPFILPARAADELLRIGVAPKRMLVADNSITFLYAKQWWMRTQRIIGEWPDIEQLFTKAKGARPRAISPDLRKAFAKLSPFLIGTSPVFLQDSSIRTSVTEDDGAMIEGLEDVRAAFTTEAFRLMLNGATHVDFTRYPEAIPFVGDRLKGLLACYVFPSATPAAEPEPDKKATPAKKRSAHK